MDYEFAVCDAFKGYLDLTRSLPLMVDCPVAAWLDPMATDAPHRVIVTCESGSVPPTMTGNADLVVTLDLKSQWTQETAVADFAAHRARLRDLRDKLGNPGLQTDADLLAAGAVVGIGISSINRGRAIDSWVMDDGWIHSGTTLTVSVYLITPASDD